MTKNINNKIFVFTSVHPWNDGRIFYRQISALKEHFEVELHAMANFEFKEVNGIKIFGLPEWKSMIDRIRSLKILSIRIWKSDATIYHFHDPELLLLAPLIKLLKKKTVVYDVHEHYPLMMLEKEYIPKFLRNFAIIVFKLLERFFLLFVDYIFYTTGSVGQRYIKIFGINAFQNANVPSIELFKEDPPPLLSRPHIAVFTGNITPVRGLKEIILAYKIVHSFYPNWQLHIFGRFYSENYREEILQIIHENEMSNYVFYHGEFSYLQMKDVLYKARIGYITYLTFPNNMACLPNKMFEYMGAGLNIVASDFENYREIIIENKCGLVTKPENIEEIATTTMNLIDNNLLAVNLSENARKQFLEKFNWEEEKKKFITAYKTVCKQ